MSLFVRLRVDPRVRGGAGDAARRGDLGEGRSPRARGSRRDLGLRGAEVGSIPACAGEPPAVSDRPRLGRVDPRVRGGAIVMAWSLIGVAGRSPRARGSPQLLDQRCRQRGSIPACAGEPASARYRGTPGRVDPRVRGGAAAAAGIVHGRGGRSPRARGSRAGLPVRRLGRGSIPACAGEPPGRVLRRSRSRVDPRVRGGAIARLRRGGGAGGRSPRARGSLWLGSAALGIWGSIPACAGEPGSRRQRPLRLAVDPRVRGGAS